MSDIGEAIRAARLDLDWTQRRLAEVAGVDIKTVSRIELGKVTNPSKADRLMRALRIGIHSRGQSSGPRDDPRLSEASMPELLAAVAARYGTDVRSAEQRATTTTTASPHHEPGLLCGRNHVDVIEDLPREVGDAVARGDIPSGWDRPEGPGQGDVSL